MDKNEKRNLGVVELFIKDFSRFINWEKTTAWYIHNTYICAHIHLSQGCPKSAELLWTNLIAQRFVFFEAVEKDYAKEITEKLRVIYNKYK